MFLQVIIEILHALLYSFLFCVKYSLFIEFVDCKTFI